jgi:hypothetical protein
VTKDYKTELAEASQRLAKLLNDRERLNIEIAKAQFRVAAFMMLTDSEEVDQEIGMTLGGLTDAILTTFKSAFPNALTPVEAKNRLMRLGFPIEHYKNPMAAVHTVISRLFDARKIEAKTKNQAGEVEYAYRRIPGEEAMRRAMARKGSLQTALSQDQSESNLRDALFRERIKK